MLGNRIHICLDRDMCCRPGSKLLKAHHNNNQRQQQQRPQQLDPSNPELPRPDQWFQVMQVMKVRRPWLDKAVHVGMSSSHYPAMAEMVLLPLHPRPTARGKTRGMKE